MTGKNNQHAPIHQITPSRILVLLLLGWILCNAMTWSPVKIKCPYCGTKSVYYQLDSYDSHTYDYPSKYEYVFWPYVDGRVLYCCRRCWFTCFAWDFFSIPEGKRDGVKKILAKMAVFETDGDYNVIPMYYRLQIAEQIYQLYERNDGFWCHFYRVKGYHCAHEGKTADAAEARNKAFAYAGRLIADPVNAGISKEVFYIRGAMQYLLDDLDGALATFKYARQLRYYVPGADSGSLQDVNKYLNDLLDHYLEKIGKMK